jgi:creatinine amidohydrolase
MKKGILILISLLLLSNMYISCSQKPEAKKIKFAEYMTPSELVEAANGVSIAYIPIGAMEWHNEHLPIGYDTIKAFELCKRICAQTGGVIFPPLYFGTNTIGTVGSMQSSPEIVIELFRSVIHNLSSQGFRVIVTLTGHTPALQMEILKDLANEAQANNKYIRVIPLTEGTFVYDEEIELFGHYQDHAAAGETSLFMYMRPDLVHTDMLKNPIEPKKDGIWWDPRYGSRENGEKIVNLITERSADYIIKEREKLYTAYPNAPRQKKPENNVMSIFDEQN